MSRLFENEKSKAKKDDNYQSEDDEAGKKLRAGIQKNDPCYRKVILQILLK